MSLAVLHKGNLADCVVCNPELKTEKKEKRVKIEKPADHYLRRQIAEELGDDEVPREDRLQLQEKYGMTAPRIDRRIKRPNWMGVKEWKERVQNWFNMTKGLVPPQQPKATSLSQQKRHAQNPRKFPKPQYGTRTGRFSSNQPNRANRPS